ncbi:hypothetical protein [Xenorhabdus miraniensis]|uniref:Uncharacterized protein n=1 Tax=Xenorhabdus miraniensis TaxID=351674 RepID=A0A2D0JQD3_9GAMM|nr:hypothetical protein [Xenorhabdus miraniensis]PHM48529.1 hypothetical protein Xmir_02332 [Xenorhabdus miraniensis]
MTKDNKIKLARLSTACDPFLDEDIGMLDKEQIKTEDFIDVIDDKNVKYDMAGVIIVKIFYLII